MALIVTTFGVALAFIALWVLRGFARGFLRPGGRKSTKTPSTMGLDGEAFTILTERGAIRGWVVRAAREPRLTVIVVHGWQSHAGDMLGWIAPILESGCHAVVYDTLGHGDSDASEFTSIRHFLEDLRTVLAHVRMVPDASGTALMGHSMGAAAALIAAAEASDIRGVIAAAAPTDAIEITREWLDARRLPGRLLISIMRPFWSPIVKGPYSQLTPITRIAEIVVPVLVLHGSADTHVPVTHAHRLAAAHPAARTEVLAGADHLSLPKHERYGPVIRDFLRDVMKTRS